MESVVKFGKSRNDGRGGLSSIGYSYYKFTNPQL